MLVEGRDVLRLRLPATGAQAVRSPAGVEAVQVLADAKSVSRLPKNL